VLAIANHAAEEMINAGSTVFLIALNFTCGAFYMLGPVEAPFLPVKGWFPLKRFWVFFDTDLNVFFDTDLNVFFDTDLKTGAVRERFRSAWQQYDTWPRNTLV
jgi:hypothetical protein